MSRAQLYKERQKAIAKAELVAGVREGHYRLDDKFVDVWVSFYPKVQWWIADARCPSGERIPRTTRPLDDETKYKLKSWL